MRRFLFAVLAGLLFQAPAHAQTAEPVPGLFASYDQMRAEIDPMVTGFRIEALVDRLVGGADMDIGQLMALQIQMQSALPNPLTNVEVMVNSPLENGFRREILAYHDGGTGYLFLLLQLHDRGDDLVVLHMLLNTSISPLLSYF